MKNDRVGMESGVQGKHSELERVPRFAARSCLRHHRGDFKGFTRWGRP